ncbi:two-component regulator propeller domain-containing protein [Bernardetia sp. OM2101]|uniref:ligand-binding sensor domain-containing protein n=1 Tax=Bernardetia sp. OM2101 TaxID=3344876 RepID=UPI0035CF9EA9
MNNWLKILFLFLLISFISQKSYAQNYVLNYQHLQTKDGLANAFVNCALQDKEGFMWFGTNDGLSRYDGKNFITLRNDEENSIFLGSNSVQAIVQLDEHYLLLGTTAGLSKLDLYTQKISTIDFFNQKNILSILIDSEKTIWIIANEQLFFKKVNHHKWQNYSDEFPSFSQKKITGIYERILKNKNQEDEKYLLITEELIDKNITLTKILYKKKTNQEWKDIALFPFYSDYFDKKNELWFSYNLDTKNYSHLYKVYDTTVFKINILPNFFNTCDKLGLPFSSEVQENDNLYSYNSQGILIIDKSKKRISNYIDFTNSPLNTSKYSIVFIYKDRTDNLWICTYGAGIAVVPLYTLFSLREYKLGASVRTIFQEPTTKNMWIGTYNKENKIDIFLGDSIKKMWAYNSYPNLFKQQIYTQSSFSPPLWFATNQGIIKINLTTFQKSIEYNTKENCTALLPLNDSTVWFAEGDILQKYNPITKQMLSSTEYGKVTCLYYTKQNEIWVGSQNNGIALLKSTHKKPVFYNPNSKSKNTTCYVLSIHQDKKGVIWLGTKDGFYRFDTLTKIFKKYTVSDGLPNEVIYAILEDENYNLWLSTNYGISKFNKETEIFENYDESDGLQNNEFNTKAHFKSEEGELFFGGINGLNAFFPNQMKRNNFVPPLYFTKITKQDSIIKFDKPLNQVKKLELPIKEAQILSFDFVALNYYRPEKNQYAYKIDELQSDWINLGNEGKLTLTGLAHGKYTLRIKAANNHGIWNDKGITLKLILVAPFYLQPWFLFSLLILFLVLVYLIYKWRLYQIGLGKKLLEEQIQKATQALANKNILFEKQNKALEKSNATQNQLFAIIAHDLRSPLIAFQDISKQIDYFLKKNNSEGLHQLGEYIDNSVQNLNTLLNNLLNWALTQQHQIKYSPQIIDLQSVTKETINIYHNLAQSLHIEIDVQINTDLFIYVDKNSFQTIIRNLISNALKFTPNEGKINILAYQEANQNEIILQLTDTGIGMSNDAQKEIFELNLAHTRKGLRGEKSTGLGLVLCYEFAQMNGITIDIESKKNEGTTFTLVIPTISPTE